jgi:DNA-directed RNA polymerase I, II, and III subunit RPABC1
VSRHELVPPHAKLTDAEVRAVMETYMLTDKKCLPSISSGDPMAKYLGVRPGDVVRVLRPSPSAGASVAYRHCVASK